MYEYITIFTIMYDILSFFLNSNTLESAQLKIKDEFSQVLLYSVLASGCRYEITVKILKVA